MTFKGLRHTEESKAKMSAAMKAVRAERKYPPMSDEQRANLRISSRGNTHFLGRHHSSATRALISSIRAAPLGAHRIHEGYVLVKVAEPNVWEREHRLVAGLVAGDNRIVHHIDGDKTNNDLANLEVMANADHSLHHHRERSN